MPFPRGLMRASIASVAVVILLPSAVAFADADPGMCKMNTARGPVPAGFVVDACVDGSSIWLRDNLELAVPFKASGDVIREARTPTDIDLASIVTHLAYSDPLILLPGDTTQVRIGPGAASVSLDLDPDKTAADGVYAVALTLETFFPLGKLERYKNAYEIIVRLTRAIAEAFARNQTCLVGQDWLGQLGCHAKMVGEITAAVEIEDVIVLAGTIAPILGKLLDYATYLQFLAAIPSNATTITSSPGTLNQAATAVTAPPIAQHLFLVECARVNPCSELLLVRTDGSGGNPRTVGGSVGDAMIAVSPDGTEVALTKMSSDGTGRLYVRSVATGSDRLLASSNCGEAYLPSWSADGHTIAYLSIGCSKEGIYTVPASGGTPTRVLPSSDNPPSWDPSGNRWAVTTDVNPQTLYIMDTNGTGKTAIYKSTTNTGFTATWSPDGSTIGVTDGKDVVGLSPDGRQLWSSRPANFVSQFPFAWALDSKSIFYALRNTNTGRVYQADPTTGRTLSVITTTRAVVFVAVSR